MQDYDIACIDCQECLWCIATAGGLMPTLIIGRSPKYSEATKLISFLIKHRGHHLKFDFDQTFYDMDKCFNSIYTEDNIEEAMAEWEKTNEPEG